jgi:hypothetical protein
MALLRGEIISYENRSYWVFKLRILYGTSFKMKKWSKPNFALENGVFKLYLFWGK